MGIKMILLIVAIILFILQALGVGAPRIQLGWVGMAFFAGAFLV